MDRPTRSRAATLMASPLEVSLGPAVSFDASCFHDPDSKITGYDWDFDSDGTVDRTTDGPTTDFTYDHARRPHGDRLGQGLPRRRRHGDGQRLGEARPEGEAAEQGQEGQVQALDQLRGDALRPARQDEAELQPGPQAQPPGAEDLRVQGHGRGSSHTFTLKVPKNVRKAAAKAKIKKLRVRVTVDITDDAGLNSHTRRNVKVKL